MKSVNTLLWLPTITDKRIIEIKYIKIDEVNEFNDLYSSKLVIRKDLTVIDYLTKLKANPYFLHPIKFQIFNDIVDIRNIACPALYDLVISKLKELISISVSSTKYKRALFIDIDNNTIAYGTTLFGAHGGYINYYDDKLNNILIGIQSYIDNFVYEDIL